MARSRMSPAESSTSAPLAVHDLAAKPIVDIQVSVPMIEPRELYVRPLERSGYLFVPDPEAPEYHFFAEPPGRPRRFHLHVCEAGSEHERHHTAVRDYLRAHPEQAPRYARLKASSPPGTWGTGSPTSLERRRTWRLSRARVGVIGGSGPSPSSRPS